MELEEDPDGEVLTMDAWKQLCVEMDRLEDFEDENDCENSSDDAASETDTQDGSIGKVTEAQECKRIERAGCHKPQRKVG